MAEVVGHAFLGTDVYSYPLTLWDSTLGVFGIPVPGDRWWGKLATSILSINNLAYAANKSDFFLGGNAFQVKGFLNPAGFTDKSNVTPSTLGDLVMNNIANAVLSLMPRNIMQTQLGSYYHETNPRALSYIEGKGMKSKKYDVGAEDKLSMSAASSAAEANRLSSVTPYDKDSAYDEIRKKPITHDEIAKAILNNTIDDLPSRTKAPMDFGSFAYEKIPGEDWFWVGKDDGQYEPGEIGNQPGPAKYIPNSMDPRINSTQDT